jgi:hypothetical protein
MWMGISKTYSAAGYTEVAWMNEIGAWLTTLNPPCLDVLFTPGVSLEWRSKAGRPDRAHFKMTVSGSSVSVAAVDSPAWSGDPAAVLSPPGYLVSSAEITDAKFAIDTFSGRAWVSVTPTTGYRCIDIFDVLPRSPTIATNCCGTSVVAEFGRQSNSEEIYKVCFPAYRVSSAGARVPVNDYWHDGITLDAPMVSLASNPPYVPDFPLGAPAKVLLPLQVSIVNGLQPHGPISIASAAAGPGFTADEVLATIDDMRIEYKHDWRLAVHAPLPANWTAA